MTALTSDRHADDGALQRLLDDQPLDDDAWVAVHAGACAACTARLHALEASSRLVHDALRPIGAAPPPLVRHVRPARSPLRWLAAAALVAASAAAASPFLRTVRWPFVREPAANGPAATARTAPRAAAAAEPIAPEVRWIPDGDTLVVRIDSTTRGTLVVSRTGGAQAIAQTTASAPAPVLVLPGELRVLPADIVDLRVLVLVPESVRRVRVLVAGRLDRVLRPEDGAAIALPPRPD